MITQSEAVIKEVKINIFSIQRKLEALILMNEYSLEHSLDKNYNLEEINKKVEEIVSTSETIYEFTANNLVGIVEEMKDNYNLLDEI